VARELDGDASPALSAAWVEVAQAIENLAAGFERYGGALAAVAQRYEELERDVTVHGVP
jgi:hypothetical protein